MRAPLPVGVFLAPVQDVEVARAELGEAPGVRLEVVEDDRGDAEVGPDLLRVDGEGDVRPLGPAVPHGARDAEGGRARAASRPRGSRRRRRGGCAKSRVAEARAALLDEAPVLLLEEGEPHVRSADVSGEQHRVLPRGRAVQKEEPTWCPAAALGPPPAAAVAREELHGGLGPPRPRLVVREVRAAGSRARRRGRP